MECPKCHELYDANDSNKPTVMQTSGMILKDWRFWVFFSLFSVGSTVIGGLLGWGPYGGAGSLFVFIYVYLSFHYASKCPKCNAIFPAIKDTKPTTPQ